MTDDDDPLAWLEDERRQPGGSRVEFQQQLEACRDKLVELSSAVSEAILPVTDAFLEADAAAAEDYRTTDRGVSAGCVALEEACYLLLARQGPVGGDLRRVVATVRCVTNVERSSNLLAHVARSLAWVHPPSMPEVLRRTLRELAEKAALVYGGAVQAWRDLDGLAAVELQRTDDEVDLLQKVLLTELYTGNQSTEESVSLALIARYFERIGDHGVEMARQVAYAVTGQRLPEEPTDSGPGER
jgi:phosphate transport system protein